MIVSYASRDIHLTSSCLTSGDKFDPAFALQYFLNLYITRSLLCALKQFVDQLVCNMASLSVLSALKL